MHLKTTISINSSDTTTSKTEQAIDEVSPATLANLSSGEFVGIVADDPDMRLELKGFHASIIRKPVTKTPPSSLPVIANVTNATLAENYQRIAKEVSELVKEETKRILGDPALRQFIVKRS